jgi:hypothetical protein
MNATETRYYVQARRNGMPAASALRFARYMAADDVFDWTHDGTRGTLTRDGFDLVATVEPDDYADGSYLGEFSDTRTPDSIKSPRYHAPSAFQTSEWFTPAITAHEHRDGLVEMGYSHAVAYETAMQYVRRDMETLLDLTEYVVTVTASRNGIKLGSASVGGVGFSDDYTEARRYADDTASELADEAIEQASAALASLCK